MNFRKCVFILLTRVFILMAYPCVLVLASLIGEKPAKTFKDTKEFWNDVPELYEDMTKGN